MQAQNHGRFEQIGEDRQTTTTAPLAGSTYWYLAVVGTPSIPIRWPSGEISGVVTSAQVNGYFTNPGEPNRVALSGIALLRDDGSRYEVK